MVTATLRVRVVSHHHARSVRSSPTIRTVRISDLLTQRLIRRALSHAIRNQNRVVVVVLKAEPRRRARAAPIAKHKQ